VRPNRAQMKSLKEKGGGNIGKNRIEEGRGEREADELRLTSRRLTGKEKSGKGCRAGKESSANQGLERNKKEKSSMDKMRTSKFCWKLGNDVKNGRGKKKDGIMVLGVRHLRHCRGGRVWENSKKGFLERKGGKKGLKFGPNGRS